MLALWVHALACAGPEVGAAEDEYGHPRALLARCTQTDGGGYQTIYDDKGYPERIGNPELWVHLELETTLDAQERPISTHSWYSEDGAQISDRVIWEADYLEDSWRLSQRRERVDREGEAETRLDYTWSRGGYQVTDNRDLFYEEDRICPRFVQLAVGLRPEFTQVMCSEVLRPETQYTWRRDRLVQRLHFRDDQVTEERFSYNSEGRLASIESYWFDAYQEEERARKGTFTWDCD